MASEYRVVGLVPAGAPPNSYVLGHLWNPSSTRRIEVTEAAAFNNTTGTQIDKYDIVRTTTRGTTPTSTVTPDADSASRADSVPPSGAVLEMGQYATDPTLASPRLYCPCVWQAVSGIVVPAGFHLPLARMVIVPPGTGLAILADNGEGMDMYEVSFAFVD